MFEAGLIGMELNIFQAIYHLIIFLAGVPLNVTVALILLCDSLLYNTRNAIWLGIIFSNLTIYFMVVLEYFVFHQQSYLACQILSALIGSPYLILLTNLLLATCDRLIYTKWPSFHEKHVTTRRVVTVQLCASAFIFLSLTIPFLPLKTSLRCGFEPLIIKVSMVAKVILCLLCTVLKLVVYFVLKRSSVENDGIVTIEIPLQEIPNLDGQNETPAIQPRLLAHYTTHRVRRMERNATMTVIIGLIPLCLFVTISCLYMVAQALCHAIVKKCETFEYFEVFFRELILLHVSTNLLVYIFRSLEFRAAAKRCCRSLLHRTATLTRHLSQTESDR